MGNKTIILLAVLAAGCTTREPGIQIRTVEVPVQTIVPCLSTSDIPAEPTLPDTLPQDARDLARELTAHILEWRLFGQEATGLLNVCAG
tara:strand:- start:7415 stop:7681 length:267 start_codon:yes stop_codon:yes gene_type:complete